MFKLSPEASLDGSVTVENKFIVEYMPYADGDHVKVYLYGLSLAARKGDSDDTVARLARRLDLDPRTVDAAIDYWTELGLMSRLGDDICYLSLRTARPKIKKYDVDKYREFNRQAQMYIAARQITPNEFHDYYALMEKFDLEWQAMVLIVNYCVRIKGDGVSAAYILAVARNLAADGYRTEAEVGDRLDEYGVFYNDVCAVMSAMGGKHPDHEAVELYKKWKLVYKFEPEVILFVAQNIKKGGAAVLDAKLTRYSELGLMTVDKIAAFEEERKELIRLAKSVNKSLGLFYDNVEPEIANYIKPWLLLGFEPGAILAAADRCMKKDLKRLSDLDSVLRDLISLGLFGEKAVRDHFDRENRFDRDIEKLLKTLGMAGAVRDIYRVYYANWKDKSKLGDELIAYAGSLAADKVNPFPYMNKLLSAWSEAGVVDVEGAKAAAPKPASSVAPPQGAVREALSAEEINDLFIHIDEEDE